MTRKVAEFEADLSLDAGISAGLSYSETDDATVYVTRPDHPPLSEDETSARLKIATENGEVSAILRLDAVALDALADAVHHTKESLREELK